MLALLKLVPLRDWLYIGLITAILAAFGLYTVHERHIGRDEALAPVAVLAQKAKLQIAVGSATATALETAHGKTYDAAHSQPAVANSGIVCRNASGSAVPEAKPGSSPGADRQAPDSANRPTYDPSGAVDTRGRDADAQIIYLQGRVHELEDQMNASP